MDDDEIIKPKKEETHTTPKGWIPDFENIKEWAKRPEVRNPVETKEDPYDVELAKQIRKLKENKGKSNNYESDLEFLEKLYKVSKEKHDWASMEDYLTDDPNEEYKTKEELEDEEKEEKEF